MNLIQGKVENIKGNKIYIGQIKTIYQNNKFRFNCINSSINCKWTKHSNLKARKSHWIKRRYLVAPSIWRYKEIKNKRIGPEVIAQWIGALLCKHDNLSPVGHRLYTSEPGTPVQVLSIHGPVSLAKTMNFQFSDIPSYVDKAEIDRGS